MLLSVLVFGLASCDNDDDAAKVKKPVVELTEVGAGNSGEVTAGSDLHLEAEAEAEGGIARIDMTLTPEGGKAPRLAAAWAEGKYVGVRNADFHEHVDILADMPAGRYRLVLTVTDKAGQSASATAVLTVREPSAGKLSASIVEVGKDNSMKAVAGGELHLEAEVNAPSGIAAIEVELHNGAAGYEKTFEFAGKYVGKTSAMFHEHIAVPADAPAGEYHLHFTVTDAEGNSVTEEAEGLVVTRK